MKPTTEMRTVCVDYQRMLIGYMRDLGRRALPLNGAPSALAGVLWWLRMDDQQQGTFEAWCDVTGPASTACDEAYLVLRKDAGRRLVARAQDYPGLGDFMTAAEAEGLDPMTEYAMLSARVRRQGRDAA